jgi:hypothetical protein
MNPDVAALAAQEAPNAILWLGVLYGTLGSFLVAAIFFIIDKIFGDYWYNLSFYSPKHTVRLNGTGVRIFDLKGKSLASGTESLEDLGALFSRPVW